MESNQFKMFCFLLKCILLVQLTYSIHSHHRFGAEATTQSEIHERMSKIEALNCQHKNEIFLLKTSAAEDRKEIHNLRKRVALLEDSAFLNVAGGDKISGIRPERPARLLPFQLL